MPVWLAPHTLLSSNWGMQGMHTHLLACASGRVMLKIKIVERWLTQPAHDTKTC